MDLKDVLVEPITEQSNELTKNIDVSSPYEITSILHSCDLEIFTGWHNHIGLTHVDMVTKMMKIASQIQSVLQNPSSETVIMSGCGTSGRLAYLTVRRFNKYLKSQGKEECFQYIIAGQDEALFTSQELAEDDPVAGAKCLEEAVKGKTRVVYIGISCGLSAVFVAGQLDFCLSDLEKFTPIVIGFNLAHLARELPIKNWNKTFLTVIEDLQEAEKSNQGFILNPVIGPEPITGSTRMKSGSTTRIILECLAMTAINGYTDSRLNQLLNSYKETCDSVYKNKDALSKLIHLGGESLSHNGHIYYLGREEFGLMAMIDASECPPTFSASLDDVRGFVSEGYSALANNDGDLSHLGHHYQISFKDFQTSLLPNIQDCDLLVVINNDAYQEIQRSVLAASCKKVFIGFEEFSDKSEIFDLVLHVHLDIPSLDTLSPSHVKDVMKSLLQEIALKWVLNNLSTGAHIRKGKVYENRMVDVKVSNTKLYYRAIGIVQKFAKCPKSDAEDSLLKSIYGKDDISTETKDRSLMEHIKVGADCDQVVPTAILIASLQCTVGDARNMIKNEPIIRKLLTKS